VTTRNAPTHMDGARARSAAGPSALRSRLGVNMHPIYLPPEQLCEAARSRASRTRALPEKSTGKRARIPRAHVGVRPTRNSLCQDPKRTQTHGWSARTVCGRSICAAISARCEHAPNLSSTGAAPRSRTIPCEPHSCAAGECPSSGNDQTFPVSKFSLRFEKKAVPD
jgi:hypothetical protein